jgi:serine/threonine-protein kinase
MEMARPGSSVYEATTQYQISVTGLAVGTPAYMSPEQARAHTVDKRTDIWAFGCVLFEMLSGRPAFGGETVTDTMAAILERDPPWSALPPAAAPLAPVLRRCLEKDARRRLRDIGDVRLFLDDAAERSTTPAVSRKPTRLLSAAIATAVVLGVAVIALAFRSGRPAQAIRVGRFEVPASPDTPLAIEGLGSAVAISPDGSRIVYTALRNGSSILVVRRLDQLQAMPIAGSEGGSAPFFSPDGQQVGFATLFDLRRVPVDGGPSVRIVQTTPGFRGAAWASDSSIVYTADGGVGLVRIPLSGGPAETLAIPDASTGERGFLAPSILPDGQAVTYTVVLNDGKTRIVERPLKAGAEPTTLVEGGFGAQYLPSGHLAFGQGDRLLAARFDLVARKIIGTPITIQESAYTNITDGVANLATAADGTGVYVTGHNGGLFRRLVWVDRRGTRTPALPEARLYGLRNVRLSPDGRRVAATVGGSGNGAIWIYDLSGAARPLRLTAEGHNTFPIWSADGKRITFLTATNTTNQIVSLPSDGSSTRPEHVTDSAAGGLPIGWSPEGATFIFEREARLWTMNAASKLSSVWLPTTPFTEFGGGFSPDGKWLVYGSSQYGQLDVWVRPFPGPGAPVRISPDGGHDPVWSRDGKEIFFTNGPKLFSARVLSVAPVLRIEAPRLVVEGFVHDDSDPNIRFFDVSRDGRLLMIEPTEAVKDATIVVVQHWDVELSRLLPVK